MTGPNLEKELPVLVCDPKRKITGFVEKILGEREEHRYNRFEIKRVDDPGKAGDLIVRGSIPQYAAVIYEGSVIKGNVGGIARVRRHDPFVPQLVVSGKGIVPDEEEAPRHILMQAARAGAIYHASTPEELKQNIGKIFYEASQSSFINGKVIKIGGSAFDYDRQVAGDPAMGIYCSLIKQVFGKKQHNPYRKKKEKHMMRRRIIGTVGAGQLGDVVKAWRGKYQYFKENRLGIYRRTQERAITLPAPSENVEILYPELMAEALSTNLKMVHGLFGNDYSSLLNTGQFYFISNRII